MTEEIKSAYEKWLAQPEMPADLAEELKDIERRGCHHRPVLPGADSAPAVCGASSVLAPTG